MRTYKGSCDCGKIRFEAEIDLSQGTFKCNCVLCTKARWWCASVKPEAFKLLADESMFGVYGPGPMGSRHFFCKACGIKPYGRGRAVEAGGEFVAVSLAALDDLDPLDWAEAPVRYLDGRNNNWFKEPAFVGHL